MLTNPLGPSWESGAKDPSSSPLSLPPSLPPCPPSLSSPSGLLSLPSPLLPSCYPPPSDPPDALPCPLSMNLSGRIGFHGPFCHHQAARCTARPGTRLVMAYYSCNPRGESCCGCKLTRLVLAPVRRVAAGVRARAVGRGRRDGRRGAAHLYTHTQTNARIEELGLASFVLFCVSFLCEPALAYGFGPAC